MDVRFIDTTFRDGSQSLWATRITTGMMDAVAADMARAGFQAIEVPANPIYFKKFVRDLKEDPWAMLRLLTRRIPETPKACMTGARIHAFGAPPPQELVRLFYSCVAATGGLNRGQFMANTMDQRTRDFPWLLPLFKDLGLQVAIALAYQVSPRHTDEYYARLTREVLKFEPDAIYLKDQGGLVTPERLRTLLPAIVGNAGGVPVEFHSHCTTGLAPICYLNSIALGACTLHTAVPPLANGSSQPSIFNVARNLRLMGHAPQIDLEALAPVSERLTAIARMEALPIGAPLEYDYAQFIHQVPGGVISNLAHQLAELRIQDRLDEVLEEVVRVQKDLGYPIMITPYSQFVATQAAINVATGERYKSAIDPVILFAMGTFGDDSGYTWMDQNLKDRLLGLPRARDLARDAREAPTLKEIRAACGANGVSDEDFLLRYIMQGDEDIRAMRAAGPPRAFTGTALDERAATKDVPGQLAGDDAKRIIDLVRELEQVDFQFLQLELGELKLTLGRREQIEQRTEGAGPAEGGVEIAAPIVGRFYAQPEPGAAPFVRIGSEVDESTTVGIIEVMKVFNAVSAGVRGVISEVCVRDGDFVEYGQRLFRVMPA
jgi:oxaloacetate decarboxylase alpha subunit